MSLRFINTWFKNNKIKCSEKDTKQEKDSSHIDAELISSIVRSTIQSLEAGKATKQAQYWPTEEEEPHAWESGHSKAQTAISCHDCHNPFIVLSNDWDSDGSDESDLEQQSDQLKHSLGVSNDHTPVEEKEKLLASELKNLNQFADRRKKTKINKKKKTKRIKRRIEKRINKTETTTKLPQSAEKSFQDELDELEDDLDLLLQEIDNLLLNDEVESKGEPRDEKDSGSNQDQEDRSP